MHRYSRRLALYQSRLRQPLRPLAFSPSSSSLSFSLLRAVGAEAGAGGGGGGGCPPGHGLSSSSFAMRHFSSDAEKDKDKEKEKDKEKDKEKSKAVGVKKEKAAKTDYKKMAMDMVSNAGNTTFLFFRHPTQIPMKLKYTWNVVKEEAHHYYVSRTSYFILHMPCLLTYC